MKSLLINSTLFLLSLSLFTACEGGPTKQKTAAPTATQPEVAGVTYTCPMHPEVVSQEPGKCPQCGMNLEKAAAAHEHQAGEPQ